MELSELKAFVKVVQTGSFTQAALALNSQKAHISRLVSQLERKLNVRLLTRSTRALSLTEVGQDIYERAIGILQAVDATQIAAEQTHATPSGTLRLTCPAEFGILSANHWMSQYLLQYPNVQIEAEYTSRIIDLVHEGFDLAIRLGPLPNSNLNARKLGELHYALYASPTYLQRKNGLTEPIQQPEQLSTHATLGFNIAHADQIWTLTAHHDRNDTRHISIHPRMRINSVFALADAARAGLGIARLPQIQAEPLVKAGELIPVLPHWQPTPTPIHALYPSIRYLSPKVRTFIDFIVWQLEQHQATHL